MGTGADGERPKGLLRMNRAKDVGGNKKVWYNAKHIEGLRADLYSTKIIMERCNKWLASFASSIVKTSLCV